MDIATELDGLRHAGKVIGPLHGIPFLVKDNIASKDRMGTTAGSWALQGSIVPRDAHVVSQLRGRSFSNESCPILETDTLLKFHRFRLASNPNHVDSRWSPAYG